MEAIAIFVAGIVVGVVAMAVFVAKYED